MAHVLFVVKPSHANCSSGEARALQKALWFLGPAITIIVALIQIRMGLSLLLWPFHYTEITVLLCGVCTLKSQYQPPNDGDMP